jgi:hypothetical protein
MSTTRKLAVTFASASLIGIALTPATPAAAAPLCKQWKIGVYFNVVQANGFTVKFQLRQVGSQLYGRAWYSPKSNRVEYGDVTFGYIQDDRFVAQVRWSNAVGTYTGTPWFVRPLSSRGLSANMRGVTYPQSGGAPVTWYTASAEGEVKPLFCPPAQRLS